MLKIFKFDTENIAQEIELFEKTRDIVLPEKYKEFLLRYNGGYTPKTSFKANGISANIRAFYGLGEVPSFYNLQTEYLSDKVNQFLQQSYLPIATDSFGNDVLICIKDKGYGNIVFYDHEKQVYKVVSDSLEQFLQLAKSKKFVTRTIEERLEGLKNSGSSIVVDDELLSLWQEEIDKYGGKKQEIVRLS